MKVQNEFQRIILILLLVFIGKDFCLSEKDTTLIVLSQVTNKEQLDNIIQFEPQYDTFSANLKFIVQLGEGKEISANAQLRIVKDKAIQLSLRVPLFGGESYRILVTSNEILILDRLHKQCFRESMQDIIKIEGFFDYYKVLESLLSNRLFMPGKKEILVQDYPDFEIKREQFSVEIVHVDKFNEVYKFVIDYTNRIQSTTINKGENQLQCRYADWEVDSDRRDRRFFPMSIQLIFNGNYKLNLFFKSVEFDKNFTIDCNIPNNYRQVELQQILRLIGNLL
ncbi:MAG: hypothetical protein Pg6B_07280 [Candidatus Azobacteroides pseudotrichonymphae]|jgi:hypothetical protein|nr:DUF4292 domain-containing protein [Bacteroidales bacterium OttesenSCG-928-I14]GMO36171.1 MAG: hypothetical protein Pg6B_07280 [Candidatus Azobacteroides pseudotrichonymphae]